MPKGDLDIFQPQLELIGIELFGPAAKTVPYEGVDNRLKTLDLGVRLALGNVQVRQPDLSCGALFRQNPGLLQDERAERVDVVGQVRLREHDDSETKFSAANQERKAQSTGNLRCLWSTAAMDSAPVQCLQKRTKLGGGKAHHAILDAGPLEAALLQTLRHQAQGGPVPPDQLDPVSTLGP